MDTLRALSVYRPSADGEGSVEARREEGGGRRLGRVPAESQSNASRRCGVEAGGFSFGCTVPAVRTDKFGAIAPTIPPTTAGSIYPQQPALFLSPPLGATVTQPLFPLGSIRCKSQELLVTV